MTELQCKKDIYKRKKILSRNVEALPRRAGKVLRKPDLS